MPMQASPAIRLALIGPDDSIRCGIADYVFDLRSALAARCDLRFFDYESSLKTQALSECQALLVHYERSRVPGPGYLRKLSLRHPGKLFVVPHEVYGKDPLAFPYEGLRSRHSLGLFLKKALYRWRHRAYAREKELEGQGYHARGVIPLSDPAAAVLRRSGAGNVLKPVPHAAWENPGHSVTGKLSLAGKLPRREELLPAQPDFVAGIFGFLNRGVDYSLAFTMLERFPKMGLLLLGGDRGGGNLRTWLEEEILRRGLQGRVGISGYIETEDTPYYWSLCDLFLCPFRFKSSSGSMLRLVHTGKPIVAGDLAIVHYLQGLGAPFLLYRSQDELASLLRRAGARTLPAFPNTYPFNFATVAGEYLRVISEALKIE